MARVTYIDPNEAVGDAQSILARIEERGSEILNLYRTVAQSPTTLRNFMRLGNSLLVYGALPGVLRELAILRVGQLTRADYEWAHHVPIAQQAGVEEEQIAALASWQTSSSFDERERAVLGYTEAVASAVTVPDDVFLEVRRHLSESEVVELKLVVGYWGMVARLLVALQVDIEPSSARYVPDRDSSRDDGV